MNLNFKWKSLDNKAMHSLTQSKLQSKKLSHYMSLYRKIFVLTFIGILFFYSGYSKSVAEDSPKSLTDLFKPYWPYKTFWAIPGIDNLKPRLALKINSEGRIIGRSRCLEIDNLEQRRIYDPLAKMTNEQIHRVACKSMKMAIREIDYLPIFETLETDEEILLKFDFSEGIVSSSKRTIQQIQVEPENSENSENSG